jgi:hypothetical protein
LKSAATFLLCLVALVTMLAAQSLTARVDRDQLHVAAPRTHFLTGEALNRLRDGATVAYEFQLTARADRAGKVLARSQERFAVSYDLWEEKFAITKLGSSPRSVSHLSAAAAEAWCVENTSIPVGALTPNEPFWLRLDYRADNSTSTSDQLDNSSFTLSGLIDIFSRRPRSEQVHGSEEVGPLRLDNLRKK